MAATVAIVAAYLQNTTCSEEQLVALLRNLHNTACIATEYEKRLRAGLPNVGGVAAAQLQTDQEMEHPATPYVPVERSVTDDYIICLEDGESFKRLTRHLRTRYGMTPAQYRHKWGLPPDYPMVAPSLSRKWAQNARAHKPHLARTVSAPKAPAAQSRRAEKNPGLKALS